MVRNYPRSLSLGKRLSEWMHRCNTIPNLKRGLPCLEYTPPK